MTYIAHCAVGRVDWLAIFNETDTNARTKSNRQKPAAALSNAKAVFCKCGGIDRLPLLLSQDVCD